MDLTGKLIIDLKGLPPKEAREMAKKVSDYAEVWGVKVADIFDHRKGGASAVEDIVDSGTKVMADVKLHDSEDTVALRTKRLASLGVSIITTHASGGVEMMRASVENRGQAMIVPVGVLSTLSDEEVYNSYAGTRKNLLPHFASMSKNALTQAFVCSVPELGLIKNKHNLNQIPLVAVGIREKNEPKDDQERVGSLDEAILGGASLVVVGRSFFRSPKRYIPTWRG